MSKKLIKALIWAAIMVVVQVAVTLFQHAAINWIEVLVGAVIVFLISYGTKSGPIYVPVKKTKGQDSKVVENDSKNTLNTVAKTENKNKDSMDTNMADLRFYSYNRIAITCLVVGIGCLVYGYVKDGIWFYIVGAVSFIESIVFFVLYTKKRNEFIEKEAKKRK